MEKIPKPRFRTILLFLSIISLFLCVANFVVYLALATIFSITSSVALSLLIVLLAGMSGGFILTSVLGSYYYNTFTRISYTITATWMGFFTYLFFSSVIYGILAMISGSVAHIIGELSLTGSVIISMYGFFHARNIQVKKVDISLEHLPEQWRGRKALWISDIHLGQIHGLSFAQKIVEKIQTLPHDIIFIGGDLYDGTGAPDPDELISPLTSLSAPLGTYFITGNHEEFGDASRFLAAIRKANIHTLIDESVDIDGLQIIGVDYHNASNTERFKNILATLHIQPGTLSILLKHEPKDVTVASQAGISFQISGHTHKGQQWPLQHIAQWMYGDFTYGLHQFKNMLVYTSSGVGTWGPPVRVGTDSEMVLFTFV